MAYKQVKSFSQVKAGKKKGYCLQNVRLGYSVPAKYDDAWTAWQNTEQHKNRSVPKGVDVPLYYDYTDKKGNRYGHINVRLKNGTVWSDGNIYASIDAYLKVGTATRYVGWGESVNDVKVIQEVKEDTDMYKGKSAKYWYTEYMRSHKNSKRRAALLEKANGLLDKIKGLVKG